VLAEQAGERRYGARCDDGRRDALGEQLEGVDLGGGEPTTVPGERDVDPDDLTPPPQRHGSGGTATDRVTGRQVAPAHRAVVVDDHGHAPGDGLPGGALVQREAAAEPARDAVLGDLVVSAPRGVDDRDAAGCGAQELAAVGEQAVQERAHPQVGVHVRDGGTEGKAFHGRGDSGRTTVVLDTHRSTIRAHPSGRHRRSPPSRAGG
jgi:hypothetical protein